jgi:hypothetical protein
VLDVRFDHDQERRVLQVRELRQHQRVRVAASRQDRLISKAGE